MPLWLAIGLFIGNFIIQRVLAPRIRQIPQHAKAASLSDFDIITATEGRVLPVLFGTRLIRGGNLAWYGNFSTVPVVDTGVTVGYKYYLGTQIFLCHGPIEVLAVRFNEKSVGASIDSTKNQLVVSTTGAAPWKTAVIAPGSYADGGALAVAIQAALKLAAPGDWRVTFGFKIVAGVNDTIAWSLDNGPTRTVRLSPGTYTGSGLASHVEAMLNIYGTGIIPDGYRFTVTYSSNRFIVKLDSYPSPGGAPGVGGYPWDSWQLRKTGLVLSTMGFRFDVDHSINQYLGVSFTGEYDVTVNRFIFGYGGTTAALRLTDALSTIATTIGFSTAADDENLGITQTDSDYVVINATFTEQTDFLQIDVNAPDFFGTDGGLSGRMDVYRGSLTQAESDYMTAQLGETAPAYRGFAHIVERGMYRGNTNYPKPESVLARRLPNPLGWTGEQHDIGGDANPAAIIYEALTDTRWGRGWPTGIFDSASFDAVGQTLKDEGFGLSMLLETPQESEEFVAEVLRHIDGLLYTDPVTGLIRLRLIRADYDLATIPVVSQDNADSIRVKRGSWSATKNVVKLRFVDRDLNYTERVIDDMDLANIQARDGEMAIEDVSYPGISNEATAKLALARTLRTVAAHIAQVTIEANRETWGIRPGDPFLLDFDDDGIVGMPCRAIRVEVGPIDAGKLTIDAIQDVTDTPWPDNGGDLTGWGVVYGYDWGGLP